MQFTFFNRLGNLEEYPIIQNISGGDFMMSILIALRPLLDDTKIELFLFNLLQIMQMEGQILAEKEISNFAFEFIATNSIGGDMKWLFKGSENVEYQDGWDMEKYLGRRLYGNTEMVMIGESEGKLFLDKTKGTNWQIKKEKVQYSEKDLDLEVRKPKFYCPFQEILKTEVRIRSNGDEEPNFSENELREKQRSSSNNWENEKIYKGLKEEVKWEEPKIEFSFKGAEEGVSWKTEEERDQLLNDVTEEFGQTLYKAPEVKSEKKGNESDSKDSSEEFGEFTWKITIPDFGNSEYEEENYDDDEKDLDLMNAINLSKITEIEENQRRMDMETQDIQTFYNTMIESRDVVGKDDKEDSEDVVSSHNSEEESEEYYEINFNIGGGYESETRSKKYSIEDSDEYTSQGTPEGKNELEMDEQAKSEYNKIKEVTNKIKEEFRSKTYEQIFGEFVGSDVGETPVGAELVKKDEELDYSDLNVKPESEENNKKENLKEVKIDKRKMNALPKKEVEKETSNDEDLKWALEKMSVNPKKESENIPFLNRLINEGRMNDVTREIMQLVKKIDKVIIETTKSNQDLWTRRSQFWINFTSGNISSYTVTDSAYSKVAFDMIKLAALKKVQLSMDSKNMEKMEKSLFVLIGKIYTQNEIDEQFKDFGIKSQLTARSRPDELKLPPVYTAMVDQKIKNLSSSN
jgi:hypothetical protein